MYSFTNSPVPIEIHRHQAASPWSYAQLSRRQGEVAETARSGGPGALLVSELAPVITLGRRTPVQDVLMSSEDLAREGIELFPTDRGGLATYHGPGQWVLFPTDRLEALTGDRRGVRQAVETLLEIACSVGRLYDSRAEIRTGCYLGVWTRKGKFASVGVHIAQGVLLHGLSVNGFQTPQSFRGLRPCGLDVQMDYLLENSDETSFMALQGQLIAETLRNFWNLSLAPEQALTVGSEKNITAVQSHFSSVGA